MAYESFVNDKVRIYVGLAVAGGHLELFDRMLTRVSDNERMEILKNNLFTASFYGHMNLVHLIIERGVDVNSMDHTGKNTLHYAVGGGFHRLVQLLFQKGSQYYRILWSDPVSIAAMNGHQEVIAVLLGHTAKFAVKGFDRNVFVRPRMERQVSCGFFLQKGLISADRISVIWRSRNQPKEAM